MTTATHSGFFSQRREGWGMDLYRNRSQSWIAGVCAGLGDHWNVPYWLVRTAAVILLFITGSLAFWGYILGILLLASRQGSDSDASASDFCEARDRSSGRGNDRSSTRAPTARLRRAQISMDRTLARVNAMEGYVTARRRQLDRKFSRL